MCRGIGVYANRTKQGGRRREADVGTHPVPAALVAPRRPGRALLKRLQFRAGWGAMPLPLGTSAPKVAGSLVWRPLLCSGPATCRVLLGAPGRPHVPGA